MPRWPGVNLNKGLTSVVILAFLVGQGIATFASVYSTLFPFTDYPMFREVHDEGDLIHQYILFGVPEDSTEEVAIRPRDLGLSFWRFHEVVVRCVRHLDPRPTCQEELEAVLQRYERRRTQTFPKLRLEDHPLALSRAGVNPAMPIVAQELVRHVPYQQEP